MTVMAAMCPIDCFNVFAEFAACPTLYKSAIFKRNLHVCVHVSRLCTLIVDDVTSCVCSSRSLPVMANVSNYRMEAAPSPPHFGHSGYDFSFAKAPATRSMFDYGRDPHDAPNVRQLAFTRTRLPSSEQISFASDGRFVVPGAAEAQRYHHHHHARAPYVHESQRPHQLQPQAPAQQQQAPIRRPQVQLPHPHTNNNYHHQQYLLRNSDFYQSASNRSSAEARYARYMNETLERSRYEAEHQQTNNNRSSQLYGWRSSADSSREQYYHSIGAYFDRSMVR